jgi:hypothetical protein
MLQDKQAQSPAAAPTNPQATVAFLPAFPDMPGGFLLIDLGIRPSGHPGFDGPLAVTVRSLGDRKLLAAERAFN